MNAMVYHDGGTGRVFEGGQVGAAWRILQAEGGERWPLLAELLKVRDGVKARAGELKYRLWVNNARYVIGETCRQEHLTVHEAVVRLCERAAARQERPEGAQAILVAAWAEMCE